MLKEILLMQLGSANRRKRNVYIFRSYGHCCIWLPQILQAEKGNYNFSLVFPKCMGTSRQMTVICCSRYFVESRYFVLNARAFSALRRFLRWVDLICSSWICTCVDETVLLLQRRGLRILRLPSSLSFQRQEADAMSNTVNPYIWQWKKHTQTSVSVVSMEIVEGSLFSSRLAPNNRADGSLWKLKIHRV